LVQIGVTIAGDSLRGIQDYQQHALEIAETQAMGSFSCTEFTATWDVWNNPAEYT